MPLSDSPLGKKGSLRRELLRGGMGSVAVKIVSRLLTLGMSLVLARVLGADDFGLYTYVFALAWFLSLPSQFGLPQLLIRETATLQASAQWSELRGLWRWAKYFSFGLGVGLACLSGIVAILFFDHLPNSQLAVFYWALALVPLIALTQVWSACLRGLRKVVQGQLSLLILRPGLIVLAVPLYLWFFGEELTAYRAMFLHVVAMILICFVTGWMVHRQRPQALVDAQARYAHRYWLRSALPLAFLAGMQQVSQYIDIVMLGFFTSMHEVGIYRVSTQGALLVVFGLQVLTPVLSPHFARLYVQGRVTGLQRLVTISSRLYLLVGLPVAMVFVLFGQDVIGLVFGRSYASGGTALAILSLGQLVNAATGSANILLNMTGHERTTARIVALGVGLNIALNLCLIPVLGLNGAAVATLATTMVLNVLLWRCARQSLGINTMAFQIFS